MSMTKAELEERVAELEAELAELKAAGDPGTAGAHRPPPEEPSFGMSEGMRAELAESGSTTSPWTGKQYRAGNDGEPVEVEEPVTPEVAEPTDGDDK